ncbi:MAG: efflux RND transporter periplasmic adaptor subunit [Syntrophales bacterium]|nr:efflux RND transporter periplasmic adaptor subunit [Syntrophales bacterium]
MEERTSERIRKGIINKGFCLGVTLFLAVGYTGCGQKEEKKVQERVVNVRVATVEKKALRPYIETVGSLRAYEEVTVSSEIDGTLRRVYVTEGARVSRGEVLAEINDTDYRLNVRQAEAALLQAEANLANYRQEHQRKEALFKEQLVTRQQYDDIAARLAVAEGEVERAKAALALAKERLTKTRIYAPLSGSVKEKRVSAGDYVRNGTPLMVVIQTDPLKLGFTVVERETRRLKPGQSVAFRVDALSGREFHGTVKTIYPHVEERTRSIQGEALVSNREGLLKPGLFARVQIYTGDYRDTVVVPITSLLYEGTNVKVFLVENGKAKEQPVKVGQKFGELMEVLDGLKGGEQLVVVGQNNLAAGVKVNVAR